MTVGNTPEQLHGYDVLDSGGNKIGTVDGVWVDDATNDLEFISVKTGWLFGRSHAIPVTDAQMGNGTVSLPYAKDQIESAPSFSHDAELSPSDEDEIYSHYGVQRQTETSPTGEAGAAGGYTGGSDAYASGTQYGDTSRSNEVEMTESAEELAVGKRTVQAGSVRLRKVVSTEHQEVPVELRREEVQIERIAPSETTETPADAFQEREIEVPVMEEQPVVAKETHVTGGVRLNKGVETEQRTVEGDVRREEIDVESDTSRTGATLDPRRD